MKQNVLLTIFLCATGLLSCTSDDFIESSEIVTPGTGPGNGGSAPSDPTAMLSTLMSLDVAADESALEETENLPEATDAYYEDYAELASGFTEEHVVSIAYDGTSATLSGDVSAVTVSRGANASDVIVTSEAKGVRYVLSGTSADGSFKIYSAKKFMLELKGLDLTNPTGAAINNQGKRVYLVLADGTVNKLADGADYTDTPADEDEKGVFFSEGKIAVSGGGSLQITSKGKHGLVSDDYVLFRPGVKVGVSSTSGHAIKTNDGIIVRGGVVNASTSAVAAKALKTDGIYLQEGGRVVALTSGGGEYDSTAGDVSGAAALKADAEVTVSGGELRLKSSGRGGKGLSTDTDFMLTGGTVKVVTTAAAYTYGSLDTKSKGVKADGSIRLSGGTLLVRATGGEGSEGIESKADMTIDGATVATYTYDDGINADNDNGTGNLTIESGYVFCYALNNDGIDANGNLTIDGGVVVACGGNAPEEGLDAAEGKTLAINGGTVVGLGGGGEALSGSQQKAAISGLTLSSGNYLTVSNGSKVVLAFQLPRTYTNATLQVSSPEFASGGRISLGTSTAATGDTSFYGLILSPTLSGTQTVLKSDISTSTTTQGSMGGGGGGFGPGGGMGPH